MQMLISECIKPEPITSADSFYLWAFPAYNDERYEN